MSTGVSCGACRHELDEPPATPFEERQPCPKCESTTRHFAIGLVDSIGGGDTMAVGVDLDARWNVAAPVRNLESIGYRVEWFGLTTERRKTWMVQVRDDDGNLLDAGVGDDPQDAILGVAERLLPPES